MIFRDSFGLPVDETMDGGDTTVRAGILAMCSQDRSLMMCYKSDSLMRRNPFDSPWDNPYNFSRDQLLPTLAGLKALGRKDVIRKLFYSHAKRLFLCQNFDRDWPGSTKYPWPHKVDGKWRLFDFADPLLPNQIGCMIKAGEIKSFYWLTPLTYLFHYISLFGHSIGNHYEENQMIAECYLLGTLKAYVKWKPRWIEVSAKYWLDRNEVEYHNMLVEFISREVDK